MIEGTIGETSGKMIGATIVEGIGLSIAEVIVATIAKMTAVMVTGGTIVRDEMTVRMTGEMIVVEGAEIGAMLVAATVDLIRGCLVVTIATMSTPIQDTITTPAPTITITVDPIAIIIPRVTHPTIVEVHRP